MSVIPSGPGDGGGSERSHDEPGPQAELTKKTSSPQVEEIRREGSGQSPLEEIRASPAETVPRTSFRSAPASVPASSSSSFSPPSAPPQPPLTPLSPTLAQTSPSFSSSSNQTERKAAGLESLKMVDVFSGRVDAVLEHQLEERTSSARSGILNHI